MLTENDLRLACMTAKYSGNQLITKDLAEKAKVKKYLQRYKI